jgi:lysostaphin
VGDGTVAFASSQGSYGNLIVINHSEGLQTRYAQLSRIQVKVGQTVKRGQTIGTVGSTGRPSSTQSHLHLEVRSRSNVGWVAENPESYLLPGAGRSNRAGR